MACAYLNCKNSAKFKDPGITFHKFPVDPRVRNLWIEATGRKNWEPKGHSFICSKHFRENDLLRRPLRTVIIDGAVPLPHNKTTPLEPKDENIMAAVDMSIEYMNLKRKYEKIVLENTEFKKKIKLQDTVIRKQEKNIKDLKLIIQRLKEEKFADQYAIDQLNSVAGANKEFLLRQLSTVSDITSPNSYSKELKAFALTLHFYSPAAYEYVRETFKLALPHKRTISRWYSKINASPGFTEESLLVLKHAAKNTDYTIVCSLMMDEMAIKECSEWDGKKHHGYVDVGLDIEEDNLPLAKNALVFMVVSINCSWKIPVGYFLINGLNTEQRCNLIMQCLTLLHETGIKVVSLTCDGLATNISTARELGCDFSLTNMKTTFKHPITQDEVAFILDPCHMLKLVRNTFGEAKPIKDENNRLILWDYIIRLQEHQVQEKGLKLRNKISNQHVFFTTQKMKVKLASQLLSSSVADAIEFCNETLRDEDFKGSEATVEFIRNFNDLFDMLNSRRLSQLGFKKPINEKNECQIYERLNNLYSYISNLTSSVDGKLMVKSNRKTGFLGFLICIKSMFHLYTSLVKSEVPLLKYLPMYKFSQDHLEMFFSTIRLHLGNSSNPTTRQFKSAYRKLLVKSEIKHSKASNCIALEHITILTATSSKEPIEIINSSTDKKLLDNCYFIPPCSMPLPDHDYIQSPDTLSEFAASIVEFIAGYVVKQLTEKLKCIDCVTILSSNNSFRHASFITKITKGGLIYPSKDVFKICKRCELIFRIAIANEGNRKNISVEVLTISTLRSLQHENLFSALDAHMHDMSPLENHTVHLIRAVANKYFNLRLFSFSKSLSQAKTYLKNFQTKIRHYVGE